MRPPRWRPRAATTGAWRAPTRVGRSPRCPERSVGGSRSPGTTQSARIGRLRAPRTFAARPRSSPPPPPSSWSPSWGSWRADVRARRAPFGQERLRTAAGRGGRPAGDLPRDRRRGRRGDGAANRGPPASPATRLDLHRGAGLDRHRRSQRLGAGAAGIGRRLAREPRLGTRLGGRPCSRSRGRARRGMLSGARRAQGRGRSSHSRELRGQAGARPDPSAGTRLRGRARDPEPAARRRSGGDVPRRGRIARAARRRLDRKRDEVTSLEERTRANAITGETVLRSPRVAVVAPPGDEPLVMELVGALVRWLRAWHIPVVLYTDTPGDTTETPWSSVRQRPLAEIEGIVGGGVRTETDEQAVRNGGDVTLLVSPGDPSAELVLESAAATETPVILVVSPGAPDPPTASSAAGVVDAPGSGAHGPGHPQLGRKELPRHGARALLLEPRPAGRAVQGPEHVEQLAGRPRWRDGRGAVSAGIRRARRAGRADESRAAEAARRREPRDHARPARAGAHAAAVAAAETAHVAGDPDSAPRAARGKRRRGDRRRRKPRGRLDLPQRRRAHPHRARGRRRGRARLRRRSGRLGGAVLRDVAPRARARPPPHPWLRLQQVLRPGRRQPVPAGLRTARAADRRAVARSAADSPDRAPRGGPLQPRRRGARLG